MHIVSSGSKFLDIDALGGIVAYAELLNAQGVPAMAVSTAPLNESITVRIRDKWEVADSLATQYQPKPDDVFTFVDVSDPTYFDLVNAHDRVASENQIVGVIDHHPGFEAYWRERLGDASSIEPIGAACTLVYERWRDAGKLEQISYLSARLLMTGILDNTLNFKAKITKDRDRDAYRELMPYSQGLDEYWAASYFGECQEGIEANLVDALTNDVKMMSDTTYLPKTLGQLVIWNAQELLANHRTEMAETLSAMNEDWAINVVSIEEGNSYFVSDNPSTQAKLGQLLGLEFTDGIAKANRLWLRKEILTEAQRPS